MRLIVRLFWHCCSLPFLGSVMTKDCDHRVGHSPLCQILLQTVVTALITSSPPAWTELRRYLPSDAVLTPAISPITGTLMEGRNVLFLPAQVQRICLLPADAFQDHEGTVSIGGRTITNLRFADNINDLAGKEEELAKLVEHLNKAFHILRQGDQCQEDQAHDKHHQCYQHRNLSKCSEA